MFYTLSGGNYRLLLFGVEVSINLIPWNAEEIPEQWEAQERRFKITPLVIG